MSFFDMKVAYKSIRYTFTIPNNKLEKADSSEIE